jgi:hypothetical protein
MVDARARPLRAALGFLSLEPSEPELQLLHRCFDKWRGIGDIVAGMARQEYDLELRRYDGRGWRAIFFQSGFEHSLTSHAGAAWARSPWEAVQRAAGDALYKLRTGEAAPRDWTTMNDAPA